ncbi:MAG: hypothetical protein PHP57_13540 [Sideroxydans sp.]|nr:hypothetical protein [Sideroxydans sp.]
MKITPSQTLFSFWRDMCGGTPLFVSAKISGLDSDRDQIHTAYKKLCRKHPVLLMRYWPGDDGYASDQMTIPASTQCKVQTDDDALRIAEVNEDQACTALNTFKQQSLSLRLGQGATACHRIFVALCAGEVHSVAIAVEHLFVDGLSCDQVLADFVNMLHTPHSAADEDNLDEFALASENLLKQYCAAFAELPAFDPYLQEFLGERTLYLGDQPRTSHVQGPDSDYRSLIVRIPNSKLSIHAKTRGMTRGFSQFSHLLACFENALQIADPRLKELVIQVATHGRVLPSAKLPREIIGCFASAMPYRLHFAGQTPINEQALAHEQRIRPLITRHTDQISSKGNQEALFRNQGLRAKLANESFASAIRLSAVSNIYFSFFGTSAADRLSQGIRVQEFDFGTSNLPGSLDVMLINVGDELIASFNFDERYFQQAYIEKLSSAFASATVVEFAAGTTNTEAPNQTEQIPIDANIIDCMASILSKVAVRKIHNYELEMELDIAFDLGIDSLGRTIAVAELSRLLDVRFGDEANERLFACASLREFITIFKTERRM